MLHRGTNRADSQHPSPAHDDRNDQPHYVRNSHFQPDEQRAPERGVGKRLAEICEIVPADGGNIHAVHIAEHRCERNAHRHDRKEQKTDQRKGGEYRAVNLLFPTVAALFGRALLRCRAALRPFLCGLNDGSFIPAHNSLLSRRAYMRAKTQARCSSCPSLH